MALRTLQKGGENLSYFVTEVCRFIVHYTEVGLRCDGEPSTPALLEVVKRACMGLNSVVHAEPAPTEAHQANGAAESMVGVLKAKDNLFVSQIEESLVARAPFLAAYTQSMHRHSCTALGCKIIFL